MNCKLFSTFIVRYQWLRVSVIVCMIIYDRKWYHVYISPLIPWCTQTNRQTYKLTYIDRWYFLALLSMRQSIEVSFTLLALLTRWTKIYKELIQRSVFFVIAFLEKLFFSWIYLVKVMVVYNDPCDMCTFEGFTLAVWVVWFFIRMVMMMVVWHDRDV